MGKQNKRLDNATITERRPGYYEIKVYYNDISGKLKRKSFSGRDINVLRDKAEDFLAFEAIKTKNIDYNSTIPEILRHRYELDYSKGYTREAGYARTVESLKKIERSFIGFKPIVNVTKEDLEQFLCDIKKYSNSVIGKTYGQLKLAYREAICEGIITKNLMENRDLRCPKSNRPDTKVYALTKEEQETLETALKNHKVPKNRNDYRKQLLIELYTGMRMGEINALRPEDVDFKRNVIHVRGTISKGVGNRIYRSETTKTSAGMRDIPLNNLVKPVLEEAIAEMKKNPDGTIFYDYKKKNVISTGQVCSFYRRICETAGLDYYGQHALRHTFATRCIEAGVQPVVLKTWLGHTNIHITLDTYADVFDKLNHSAINVFESYLVS